jgi:hypothetical protein
VAASGKYPVVASATPPSAAPVELFRREPVALRILDGGIIPQSSSGARPRLRPPHPADQRQRYAVTTTATALGILDIRTDALASIATHLREHDWQDETLWVRQPAAGARCRRYWARESGTSIAQA